MLFFRVEINLPNKHGYPCYLRVPLQNWNKPREFDCLIKTKHCDGPDAEDGDTMWFLPSALNVKVERFQASTG